MITIIRIAETHRIGGAASAVYEFICSETGDIANLPTGANPEDKSLPPHPGSSCICTADTSVHMLGPDDVWHEM